MSKLLRQSCVILIFVLTSFRAYAMDANQAAVMLEQTYHVQIESYYAINSFYNFSANFGDKGLMEQTHAAINKINETLNEIEGAESAAELQERITPVSNEWQEFKKLLQTNIKIVSDTGYPDLRLVDDLARTNLNLEKLLKDLYAGIQETANFNPDRQVEESRQSAILMALMMTKYSARTTSNVSQVFQGSDSEKPIDELAHQFDKNLKSIIADASGKPDSEKLLDAVETTWNFIKNSYINYNENNVNFVINLYSRKIIRKLEQATGQYSAKASSNT